MIRDFQKGGTLSGKEIEIKALVSGVILKNVKNEQMESLWSFQGVTP